MMKEIRALPVTLEARKADDTGKRTIAGRIAYNEESQVLRDMWGDPFIEELAPGCFDESIKTRDVAGLWSHDLGRVLGNTRNGTLRLASSDNQLTFELDLPDTQAGNDAWESIQRGDVDGMSFGMVVKDDKWSSIDRDGQTIYKRTIIDADLYEVSPVVFATYPANEVACRSLEKFKEELNMGKETETRKEDTVKKELDKVNGEEAETRTIPPVVITGENKQEQRDSFNHYLRTGEIRAMMVTSPTTGEALAPDDFAKEIIDGLTDEVVMRQLARILPAISGKSAVYPRRTGGGGAAMVEEGTAIIPHDLTFDQVTLVPKKAAAIVEVSNELLQDTGVDLAGYLAQHFIDEIGELLENQYWNGDATDANLQGILTADDGATLLIERIPSAAATIDTDDILALWAALPAKYRKNATFVCNSAMEAVLRKLKDGDGRYLMVNDLTQGLGNTLLGRPLVTTEEFPGTLEAGTDALMVGDFQRGVYIADKAGIDIQRNDAIGFNKDVTAFRAIFRTDIALAWPDALRVLAVNDA